VRVSAPNDTNLLLQNIQGSGTAGSGNDRGSFGSPSGSQAAAGSAPRAQPPACRAAHIPPANAVGLATGATAFALVLTVTALVGGMWAARHAGG